MPEDQLYAGITETLKKHGIGVSETPTAKPASEITVPAPAAPKGPDLLSGIQDTLKKHGIAMPGASPPGPAATQEVKPIEDFTDKYNTPLPPDKEAKFQAWAKDRKNAAGGMVLNDLPDYDVRGRWQQLEQMSPEERAKAEAPGAHGPDTWKKPSHITFSNESKYHGADSHEGGAWGKDAEGKDTFTPGATNLKFHGAEGLQKYFTENEPGLKLLPGKSRGDLPEAFAPSTAKPEEGPSWATQALASATKFPAEIMHGFLRGGEQVLDLPRRLITGDWESSTPTTISPWAGKAAEAAKALEPKEMNATKFVGSLLGGLAGFALPGFATAAAGYELPFLGASLLQKFGSNLLTFGFANSMSVKGAGGSDEDSKRALLNTLPQAALFTVAQSIPFDKLAQSPGFVNAVKTAVGKLGLPGEEIAKSPWLSKIMEMGATGTAFAGSEAIEGQRDPASLAVSFLTGAGIHLVMGGLPQKESSAEAQQKRMNDYFNRYVVDWKKTNEIKQAEWVEMQNILDRLGVGVPGEAEPIAKTPQPEAPTPEAQKEAIFGGKLGETIEGQTNRGDAIKALVPIVGDQARAERFHDLYEKGDAVTALKEFPEFSAMAPEAQRRAAITPAEREEGPAPMRSSGAIPEEAVVATPVEAASSPQAAEDYIAIRKLVSKVELAGDPAAAKRLDDLAKANPEIAKLLRTEDSTDWSRRGPILSKMSGLMRRIEETGDPNAVKELSDYIAANPKTLEGFPRWPVEPASTADMVTSPAHAVNPAGRSNTSTPSPEEAPAPPRVPSPPPEPPSSAPAQAGGGGTVGLSAGPAGEGKAGPPPPEAPPPAAPMGSPGAVAESLAKKPDGGVKPYSEYSPREIAAGITDDGVEIPGYGEEGGPPLPGLPPGVKEFQATRGTAGKVGPPKGLLSTRDTLKEAKVLGNKAVVKTAEGTKVPTQYAVVDINDLVTSHDNALNENPNFPQDLQPRKRDRAASIQQVGNIETRYDPEQLGVNPLASDGAPIVGPDMLVESGNGRTIAGRRLYENYDRDTMDRARNYQKWLLDNAESFGLDREDIEGVERPFLVRVRTNEITPEARQGLVKEMNTPSVAPMSAMEIATADGKTLRNSDLMVLFNPGADITSKANRGFVSGFMKEMVSHSQVGQYVKADGSISKGGYDRIRNAIFAAAYGDSTSLEKLAEDTKDPSRNITTALYQVAPRFAKQQRWIEQGDLHDLSIAQNVTDAADLLIQIKESTDNKPIELPDGRVLSPLEYFLKQPKLIPYDKLTLDIVQIFEDYKKSPKKIQAILNDYLNTVEKAGNPKQPDVFGMQPDIPTREEALELAVLKVEEEDARIKPPKPSKKTLPEALTGGSGKGGPAAETAGGSGAGPEGEGGPEGQGPSLVPSKLSIEGAFGLKEQEQPASTFKKRLQSIVDDYPGIDRDRAAAVLRALPNAEDGQIANMAADPEMFAQVARGNLKASEKAQLLKKASDAGAQGDLFGGGGRGGDTLFKAGEEAAFTRGLTTEQIQGRLGKYGAVSELSSDTFPSDSPYARGWIIREESGQLVMVREAKDGSLKMGFGQTLGKDYESLGVTSTEGKVIAGSHTPFSMGSFIEVAKGQGLRTIDHELWHRIEHFFLTDKERAAIIRDFGGNEEARAEAYADWNPKEAPNTIFQKILDFFQRITKAITGKVTGEDVFAAARNGELFSREPVERSLPDALAPGKYRLAEGGEWGMEGGLAGKVTGNIKSAREEGKAAKNWLMSLFASNRTSKEALSTHQIIAGSQAESATEKLRMQNVFMKYVEGMGPIKGPETQEFLRLYESGQEAQITHPLFQAFGEEFRAEERRHMEIMTMLGDAPKEIPNYIDHLWKQNEAREQIKAQLMAQISGGRSMRGPDYYKLLRTIVDIPSGIAQGLEPKFDTLPEMVLAGRSARENRIAATKRLNFIKENGYEKVVRDLDGGTFTVEGADGTEKTFKSINEARAWAKDNPGSSDPRFNPAVPEGWKVYPGGYGEVWTKVKRRAGAMIPEAADENVMPLGGGPERSGYEEVPKVDVWTRVGHRVGPEDVVRQFEDFLSRGMSGNTAFEIYQSALHAVRHSQMALSFFHAFFESLNSVATHAGGGIFDSLGGLFTGDWKRMGGGLKELATSPLAPFKDIKFGLNINKRLMENGIGIPGEATNDQLLKDARVLVGGGMRPEVESKLAKILSNHFKEAWKLKGVSTGKAINELLQGLSSPTMEVVVPFSKQGSTMFNYLNEVKRWERSHPGEAPTEKDLRNLAYECRQTSDFIYGRMAKDNVAMNGMVKSLLTGVLQFPTWQFGTVGAGARATVGAKDVVGKVFDMMRGKEIRQLAIKDRQALQYVTGLLFTVGMTGGLMTYAFTGKKPETMADYFFPKTGETNPNGSEERLQLPSYFKDAMGFSTHPFKTIGSKLASPIHILTDLIQNKDYWGNQIYDPHDWAGQRGIDVLKYMAKTTAPFALQSFEQGAKQTPGRMAMSLFGVRPVSREIANTPAQNVIDEYNQMMRASTTTKETAEKKKLKSDLMKMARDQDGTGFEEMASQAVKDGQITRQQVKEIIGESQAPPNMARFTKLPLEWATRAYDAGSDYEREQWKPYYLKKVMAEKPENLIKHRDPVVATLREMGLDEAADAVDNLVMAEEPLGGIDLAGLGMQKDAPEMSGMETVDAAIAQALEQNLKGKEKRVSSNVRLPSTREKKKPYSVLGL